MQIIQSRLEGVPGNIVDPDAIQFASRKVAAVSGDARRCLDICRRAVELAEESSQGADPSTPSRRAKANEEASKKPEGAKGKVTIATVRRAIDEATSSPMQQYLRSLPLSSKLFLAALLAKTRRTGLPESVLGEVIDEGKRMAKMSANTNIHSFLLSNTSYKAGAARESARIEKKAPRVLVMGVAAMELMEAGIVALERRGERTGKVRLNVGDEEVKLALKDDVDVRGMF